MLEPAPMLVLPLADGSLGRLANLFTKHLRHEEDDEGPEKASASKEIDQGVTSGGKYDWLCY